MAMFNSKLLNDQRVISPVVNISPAAVHHHDHIDQYIDHIYQYHQHHHCVESQSSRFQCDPWWSDVDVGYYRYHDWKPPNIQR